jgi:spoIIIJ-associated protein
MDDAASVVFAKKFMEDLLAFYEVNSDVEAVVNDEIIELSVPSTEYNSILIGRNAETLRAMQYLLSTTLRNNDASLFRINIDIAGYKKQRAEKLAVEAKEWIEAVIRTGDTHVASLNAADRRIVHQVATEYQEIQTFSEGEGRERKIIIAQKSS